MGWETRKGNRYYYAKRRVGSKVQSIYLGKSTLAEEELLEKQLHRQTTHLDREAWHQLETALDQNQKAITQLLLMAGLHRHRWGRWRKKRTSHPNPS